MLSINFRAIREDEPGEKWQALFNEFWASYRAWFLSEGHQARPGYLTCRRELKATMPELMPIYDRLVQLGGGGDLVARFLSLYRPPLYLAGCSQAIWTRDQPALVRNYDYSPYLTEAVLLYTDWLRPVIAMSDCLWGVLDGINDAGLVVSLSFGGRKITDVGFGIPLILRYLLEVCDDTASALEVLRQVPSHMAYNIGIVDAMGDYATVFVAPNAMPIVRRQPVSTNYQEHIEWEDYANVSGTEERQEFLEKIIGDGRKTLNSLIRHFMVPPLYQTRWEQGFGTLYTVAYTAQQRRVVHHWPGHRPVVQSFDNFTEKTIGIMFRKVHSLVK